MFDLPAVLVPPEALDLEGDDAMGAPGPAVEDGQPRPPIKQNVPYVFLSIFPSEVNSVT